MARTGKSPRGVTIGSTDQMPPPRPPGPTSISEPRRVFIKANQRYKIRRIAVPSNRVVQDLSKYLGDITTATTILDRLMHRSHLLKFEGKSYRLKEPAARLVQPPSDKGSVCRDHVAGPCRPACWRSVPADGGANDSMARNTPPRTPNRPKGVSKKTFGPRKRCDEIGEILPRSEGAAISQEEWVTIALHFITSWLGAFEATNGDPGLFDEIAQPNRTCARQGGIVCADFILQSKKNQRSAKSALFDDHPPRSYEIDIRTSDESVIPEAIAILPNF